MSSLGLKSLSRNVVGTLIRQVGATILALAATAVIGRYYGKEGNGAYSMALLLPALLSTFLSLGVGPANVYFLGSEQVSLRGALRANLRIWLVLSVMGTLVGAGLIVARGEEFFSGVDKALLWTILPGFPLALLSGFLASLFQGIQEFGAFNRILIIQPLLFLFGAAGMTLVGVDDLRGIALVFLASHGVVVVTALARLKRHFDEDATTLAEPTRGYTRQLLGYGWKAHLSNILGFVNYKADIFLVNFFLNPAATGVYVVSVALAEKLWLVSNAVSTVLLPRLSQLSSDEQARKELTPLVSRIVFAITTVSSLAVGLAAYPFIVLVFGFEFEEAFKPLLMLLPGVVLISGARVWANDLAARGRPELNTYMALATLAGNIVGNVLLIPRYGLLGAAAATSLAYLLCAALTLGIYASLTKNRWIDTLFIKSADVRSFRDYLRNRRGPAVDASSPPSK